MNDGDLTLIANNQAISGWETVRVTRGIERCPNDFDISLSEPFSKNDTDTVVVQPGNSCQIKIRNDAVITGYIDKYVPFITPTTHGIRITGRGKCQDLVDCAAEWPGGQISESSVLTIAKKLASVYPGLNASASDGVLNVSASDYVQSTEANQTMLIPKQNVIIGETAYELIERLCRFRGYLAYELPDGSLYLSQVGTIPAASGFEQGQNVQQASFEMSIDRRYSSYECYYNSLQIYNDIGFNVFPYYSSTDTSVLRNRKMKIVMEGGALGQQVCMQRANWENARRVGRSNVLTLTTDSWRDSAGTLWTPNTIVPISLPALKLQQVNWVIGDVTYKRDTNGTTADLVLMPPGAFLPQPINLPQGLRELQGAPQ